MIADLFAGPGGWDFGASKLDLHPVGYEYDDHACATRAAAGLITDQQDLSTFQLDASIELEGLIASPPCPAFSTAGLREGVDWLPHLCEVAVGQADLDPSAPIEASLSLAPLRWTLRHKPRWIAWEQVPPIMPLWKACAHRLRSLGYSTWTGTLCAADFGVPQTRTRAILIASLDRNVLPPEPTHGKNPEPSLFGPELKPWMSMAEAIGWGSGSDRRAVPTLTGARAVGGGHSSSRVEWFELLTGQKYEIPGDRESGQKRPLTEPAPTVGTMANSQWIIRSRDAAELEQVEIRGAGMIERHGTRPGRPLTEPSKTIAGKNEYLGISLRAGDDASQRKYDRTERRLDEPAPTVLGSSSNFEWVDSDRPATTIMGDPRLAPPGHHESYGDRAGTDEVKAV